MLCTSPINGETAKGRAYQRRCGSCLNCVMSRAAMWTLRLGLENTLHKSSTFTTLTYGPEKLTENGGLSKSDAQDFLKKLRISISRLSTSQRIAADVWPASPRYYCVGEYGDQLERPHYHVILFGLGIGSTSLQTAAWGKGRVHVLPFNLERAAYVARYTTSKSFWPQIPSDGRAKEFSIMSKKPGLGRGALQPIADTLKRHNERQIGTFSGTIPLGNNTESLWTHGVPESLRYEKKIYPMGSYLVDSLVEMLELPDRSTPEWDKANAKRAKDTEMSYQEASEARLAARAKGEQIHKRQLQKRL